MSSDIRILNSETEIRGVIKQRMTQEWQKPGDGEETGRWLCGSQTTFWEVWTRLNNTPFIAGKHPTGQGVIETRRREERSGSTFQENHLFWCRSSSLLPGGANARF